MRPASRIFGFTALVVWLAGFGHGKVAHAEDALATELGNQLAVLIGAPFESENDSDTGGVGQGWQSAVDSESVAPVVFGSHWSFISNDASWRSLSDELSGAGEAGRDMFPPPREIGTHGFSWQMESTVHLTAATGPSAMSLGRPNGRTFDPLTDHFWPVAGRGRDADIDVTFSEPVGASQILEAPLLSDDVATADERETEAAPGPVNFPVGKSFKIKAQPVGGGLGGRVTFTFLLPAVD